MSSRRARHWAGCPSGCRATHTGPSRARTRTQNRRARSAAPGRAPSCSGCRTSRSRSLLLIGCGRGYAFSLTTLIEISRTYTCTYVRVRTRLETPLRTYRCHRPNMLAQTVKYALRNPPNMPRICSCMLSIFRRGALGAGLSAAQPAGRRVRESRRADGRRAGCQEDAQSK
jgi:hypothetical protein